MGFMSLEGPRDSLPGPRVLMTPVILMVGSVSPVLDQ